jgi:hypothetical protein
MAGGAESLVGTVGRDMWKRILILVVAVGCVGWFLVYCAAHAQAERKSRLIGARNVLGQAYEEYARTGNLPSRNGSWKIMVCTNDVRVSGRVAVHRVRRIALSP